VKSPTIALLLAAVSAASLVLIAGFSTNISGLDDFTAVTDISAINEPINVNNSLTAITIDAAGDQDLDDLGDIVITKAADVSSVTLQITLVNAEFLAQYFDYAVFTFTNDNSGTVVAVVDLSNPTAVFTLDADAFDPTTNQATLSVTVYYEASEGILFEDVPVIFNIEVLGTT